MLELSTVKGPTDTRTCISTCTRVDVRALMCVDHFSLQTQVLVCQSSRRCGVSMSSEDELNLLAVACVCVIKKKQQQLNKRLQPRRKWVKEWFLKRTEYTYTY